MGARLFHCRAVIGVQIEVGLEDRMFNRVVILQQLQSIKLEEEGENQ